MKNILITINYNNIVKRNRSKTFKLIKNQKKKKKGKISTNLVIKLNFISFLESDIVVIAVILAIILNKTLKITIIIIVIINEFNKTKRGGDNEYRRRKNQQDG